MTKKRKVKKPTKLVRIDHRTLIQVSADTNDEVARQMYVEKLEYSRTEHNRKAGHRKKGNVNH